MKKHQLCAYVFLTAALAFSQQNAFEKCVEACLNDGVDSFACMTEVCDIRDTAIHIIPEHGNPLLLPSYELKGPAPIIDGSLMSRDGDPSTSDAKDEWKEACSRTLILNDSGVVQLFLCNSKDTLYIGFTYEHGNNGDGCGVRLLFDEGNNALPSQYDGTTDLKLDAPGGSCNEQGCAVYKSGGGVILQDLCWNGTAWIEDGDSAKDFRGAKAYFNSDKKVHHNEFAIPLNNGKSDDASNSDLNVNFNDIIGFYLEVIKMGAGAGTWHWLETNGQPTKPEVFPNWARIQLSVKREFFTFYTGRSSTVPTIDGAINEPAWNGAYQRELILSNYHYGYFRSKIWCLEDSAQNSVFIGLRIFDKVHNPGDYCQIYLEEDGTNTTSATRNYILDNNAETALRATNANQFSDYFWNMDSEGWAAVTGTDAQSGTSAQDASYTEYEFKVQRSGGMYHIDIPKGGLLGFLIRFHDADKTQQDFSNFFWEYTTNNDAQLLDQQSHPYVYVATGWANLQLGGPFLEVVKPATGEEITGTVQVEVNSGTDSLSSVVCFLASDTTKKVSLVYQGNGTWTGSIDVSQAGTESQMLVIEAVTAAGLVVQRVINKVEPPNSVRIPVRSVIGRFGVERIIQSPAQGVQFLVTMNNAGGLALEMYSITGKKIWGNRILVMARGQYWIDLTGNCRRLGNGTYMLVLASGNDRVIKKFTIFK